LPDGCTDEKGDHRRSGEYRKRYKHREWEMKESALNELSKILELSAEDTRAILLERKYTIEEAAKILNTSTDTTDRLIKDGALFSIKCRGRRRIPERVLIDYLSKQFLASFKDNGIPDILTQTWAKRDKKGQ
jgi:excisionase family DNA binding protein